MPDRTANFWVGKSGKGGPLCVAVDTSGSGAGEQSFVATAVSNECASGTTAGEYASGTTFPCSSLGVVEPSTRFIFPKPSFSLAGEREEGVS
jgi:hypothetical protein